MTIRTSTTSPELCSNPDAALLAMIARHDQLWRQWDAAGEAVTDEVVDEACDLERTVAATPAFTKAGLVGKRRVIERAAFNDSEDIVKTILQLDAERIAADLYPPAP